MSLRVNERYVVDAGGEEVARSLTGAVPSALAQRPVCAVCDRRGPDIQTRGGVCAYPATKVAVGKNPDELTVLGKHENHV
ncbi:MAG: hypothetical protein V9E81_11090 [Marmoricola sp.]